MSWRAGRGTFCFLSKTGNPRSRWICCAPRSLFSYWEADVRCAVVVFFCLFFFFANVALQCWMRYFLQISLHCAIPIFFTMIKCLHLNHFGFYGAKIKLRNNGKMGDSTVKPQWENDGSTPRPERPFCVELVRLCGFTLGTLASSHSCSQNFSVAGNDCFFSRYKLKIQNQNYFIHTEENSVCNWVKYTYTVEISRNMKQLK